jgi:hypothetical protein
MTKSSCAAALLLTGWGAAAAAAPPPVLPVTFDLATTRAERRFGAPIDAGCPDTGRGSDEEIVVCGRSRHRPLYRLPLPIKREPGETVRHINERGSGVAAMAGGACSHSCYQPVTVNPIAVILAAPKVIRHILGRDD